ncbi:MerR family transcriptional regulator [Ralstonia soli]|uniref:MerR family transcriptional regulator n=1 Tax=Ralstonia soli TaxID=2953896 RepID=A0ABT1ATC1_9RALS|nr:MerR family transcriptional regulator [Ralstonia soli]MCO5401729.1 MerR family transcriptional regulator [Ralstonia soli]
MKIGELAARTGLTASRIRFYERIGLLKTVDRQPNGYRTYPPEALLVLDLVATAQNAGFSLDEIRMLLPPDLAQWERSALLNALHRKVHDMETLQTRLAQSKAHIVALIAEIESKPDGIDCVANAQRLLSWMLQKHRESPTLARAPRPSEDA